MESEILPIKSKTLISLPDVNVPTSLMKFKNVSIQSDKFVCVRADDHISIVDLKSKNVAELKTVVDSVIINPLKNIIGLKSGSNLQVFDLSRKEKVNSTIINSNVEFWLWIDEDTIALITSNRVFHWSIPNNGEPNVVFDREPFDGMLQIINYRASVDKNWLVLGGIAASENGGIDGVLQLFSKIRQRSQMFRNAHAGCFASVVLAGSETPSDLFCFTHKTSGTTRLSIVEVAAEKTQAFHAGSQLTYRNENDFAVSIQADQKHVLLFLVTKLGFLFLADIQTGTQIFSMKISNSTVFASAPHDLTGGIVTVGQDGFVKLYYLDRENVVGYLTNEKKDYSLATQIAIRLGLSIDEKLFVDQFDTMLKEGNYLAAIQLAESAPNNALRTEETIQKFSLLSPKPGQSAPVLQYFSYLMKNGTLNEFESISLVEPILSSNTPSGKNHIEQWIRAEKLHPSEKLGDLLAPYDAKLTCSIYLRAGCVAKAIDCFLLLGQFKKILPYARRENYQPDYGKLLEKLWNINRENAQEFALELQKENLLDPRATVDLFMRDNDYKAATSFLLDFFRARGDNAEDADLQTQLLAINLANAPEVAEAILESTEYHLSHYNHLEIASLCENVELYAKSLENYNALDDMKRCLKLGVATGRLERDFILNFFGEMSPQEGLECLADLLEYDIEHNLDLVVSIAQRFSKQMTPAALVKIFEQAGSPTGAFRYLGIVVNSSTDPNVVFDYIRVAARAEQFLELRRVCQQNTVFEPQSVMRFLLESNLDDPRPLIVTCDRFGFVSELTRYLYQKKMIPFIEAYLWNMNCRAAPQVIATLFDLDMDKELIAGLLEKLSIEALGVESFQALVTEISTRGCLPIMLSWLEKQAASGCTEVALHNALAYIYIEQNASPEEFLENNKYYDHAEIGRFCELRDARLAFIAYRCAGAGCDEQLLRVARDGGFYAELAQLLVSRQDEQLWLRTLETDDEHRHALIAQVVCALGRSREPEEVSVAVKAFIAAELPKELIELLERLVITGPPERGFRGNKNLQNLLILTAIKADPRRVMSYLNRLEDYDGPDIARIAESDQYRLYEEAFEIYVKFGLKADAARVLVERIGDLERMKEFAERAEEVGIWELLAEAQLEKGEVSQAIEAFLKAESSKRYEEVIEAATSAEKWTELISYLQMVRKRVKNLVVDSELLYSLAKTNNLEEFRNFLASQNFAKIDDVGCRFTREELYEPAKMVYEHTKNYSRLALCFINLSDFEQAVSAAEKANNIQTWKIVCYACVDADEFSLAQFCAARVVVHAEQLKDLISHYEQHGYFKQIVDVLEKSVLQERAHAGLFTALGVLYCKYQPEKLMAHLKAFADKLSLQEMIKMCLKFHKWPELVFLFRRNEQFDRAAEVMMDHSPSCFEHMEFKEVVANVSSCDLLFKVVDFYTEEHPLLLNEILKEIGSKLDCLSVIKKFEEKKLLLLIFDYLLSIQQFNKPYINEVINRLHIEEENFTGLTRSIKSFDAFDSHKLAIQLEDHHLKQFRCLAASLYNVNKEHEKALKILRKDKMYEKMILTVKSSGSRQKAEELINYFVEIGNQEELAACLFDCRELVSPHLALEIGWRYDLNNCVMPFIIQMVGNFEDRLVKLERINEEREKKEIEKNKAKKEEKRVGTLGPSSMLAITSGKHRERQANGDIFLFD